MPDAAVRLRAFSRFFTDAATPVDLHDDRLIVLDDLSEVLLVEHGAVDVFAVHLENQRPQGRWTFLCRVNAGTLLHGSPRGPRHALACRPVPRSYVSTLPLSRLAALSAATTSGLAGAATTDTPARQAVRKLSAAQYAVAVQQLVKGLDSGLAQLTQALRDSLPPREFTPLAPRGQTEVAAGRDGQVDQRRPVGQGRRRRGHHARRRPGPDHRGRPGPDLRDRTRLAGRRGLRAAHRQHHPGPARHRPAVAGPHHPRGAFPVHHRPPHRAARRRRARGAFPPRRRRRPRGERGGARLQRRHPGRAGRGAGRGRDR